MIVRHCLLFAIIIIATYTDLARGKIYNWCTLPAIVLGLMVNGVLGGLWDGGWLGANVGGSALALLVVAVLFAWPYFKGGIAAGDVKLVLAVAAIGSFHNMFIAYALFYCALIGALMAVLVFIWRGQLIAGLKGTLRFTFSTERFAGESKETAAPGPRITVPYGLAIAIGSIVAWYRVELIPMVH